MAAMVCTEREGENFFGFLDVFGGSGGVFLSPYFGSLSVGMA